MTEVEEKDSEEPGCWGNFKQQTASAWVPSYSAYSISPVFIALGILLIPIGIVFIIFTNKAKVVELDYTFCESVHNPAVTCAEFIRSEEYLSSWKYPEQVCQCEVNFQIKEPIEGKKIYMYYGLKNFHQNVRKYISSRDDQQLLGKIGSSQKPAEPNKDCYPFDKDAGKIIYPCGAIANSMFNDSIQLYYKDSTRGKVKIHQQRKGIAWSTEVPLRYKNPPEFSNINHPIWEKFTKPKDWSRTLWDLDPINPDNNGVENEDFLVWMRPAALSTFQKLYRIIEPGSQTGFGDSLPIGNYSLQINYTYEVTSFNGRKKIFLSVPSIFGQQNLFQGIFSVSLGGVCVVLGLLLLLCGCNGRFGKRSIAIVKPANDNASANAESCRTVELNPNQ